MVAQLRKKRLDHIFGWITSGVGLHDEQDKLLPIFDFLTAFQRLLIERSVHVILAAVSQRRILV